LLIAIIPLGSYTTKDFNCFEFVEQSSMTIDDRLWVLFSNIVCDTWSNNFGYIFCLGFHINIKTMFLSYVSGSIFECDKFQGLHFYYLSYVFISSYSHLFWIIWMLTILFFMGPYYILHCFIILESCFSFWAISKLWCFGLFLFFRGVPMNLLCFNMCAWILYVSMNFLCFNELLMFLLISYVFMNFLCLGEFPMFL
jgi:hypothetical protein